MISQWNYWFYNKIFSFNLGFRTPFNIYVHTDNSEGTAAQAETMNRGFCLDYVQQPCSVAGWKLPWKFEPLNVVTAPKEEKTLKHKIKTSWNELV